MRPAGLHKLGLYTGRSAPRDIIRPVPVGGPLLRAERGRPAAKPGRRAATPRAARHLAPPGPTGMTEGARRPLFSQDALALESGLMEMTSALAPWFSLDSIVNGRRNS